MDPISQLKGLIKGPETSKREGKQEEEGGTFSEIGNNEE